MFEFLKILLGIVGGGQNIPQCCTGVCYGPGVCFGPLSLPPKGILKIRTFSILRLNFIPVSLITHIIQQWLPPGHFSLMTGELNLPFIIVYHGATPARHALN